LYLRLANSYLNVGQYRECASAAREGLQAGELKSPDHAHISLGMCLYNLKQYNDSIDAFRAAARTERSRRVANQWIDVINSEVKRNEQIREAEVLARRQQQALEERLARTDRGL
jgi:tetratricopeptide (TPR) repeat protein